MDVTSRSAMDWKGYGHQILYHLIGMGFILKRRIRNTETCFFDFKPLKLLSGSQRTESIRKIPKK